MIRSSRAIRIGDGIGVHDIISALDARLEKFEL